MKVPLLGEAKKIQNLDYGTTTGVFLGDDTRRGHETSWDVIKTRFDVLSLKSCGLAFAFL